MPATYVYWVGSISGDGHQLIDFENVIKAFFIETNSGHVISSNYLNNLNDSRSNNLFYENLN